MARGRKGRRAVPRIAANKGRRLQRAAPSGRVLFDAERKERFLRYFCGEANLSWAARKVGVHYRTVLRHRATDPVFAEAYDLAEAQALPRLRAWLVEAKAEEARRLKAAVVGPGAGSEQAGAGDEEEEEEEEEEPGGEIAPARLSVEQAMQFLRDHEQSQARRERAARMGPGRGNGRPVSVASNAEVEAALVKALRAHGIRVRGEMGTGASDCPGAGGAEPSGEGAGPVTPPSRDARGLPAQPVPPSGLPPAGRAAPPPSPSGDGEDER